MGSSWIQLLCGKLKHHTNYSIVWVLCGKIQAHLNNSWMQLLCGKLKHHMDCSLIRVLREKNKGLHKKLCDAAFVWKTGA